MYLIQIFGGIAWNTYFMRILSARSVRDAQIISVAGGFFTLCLGVPPFLLGVVGVSTSMYTQMMVSFYLSMAGHHGAIFAAIGTF